MKINHDGLTLIKKWEGFREKAYKLQGEKYFTIGYGHSYDSEIKVDTVWSKEEAETELEKDLEKFEKYVDQYTKQYGFKLNENQFSALVSYCYNRGKAGLIELLSHSKSIHDLSKNIVIYWGRATRYKNGIMNRRNDEKALFDKTIPKPKEHIVKYTIKKGDTLEEIALKHFTKVDRILKLNPSIKNKDVIITGKSIKIPKIY
jgi:GH24 family phage-related lysozyme (muramidase)